jgi:hypothetical protein|tara:strand:- start:518 stop:2404 length:1887 start_codon:yes stop_codon:yes gene_type:complete
MVATRNITDLAALSTPSADDILLIVDRLTATSSEAKQITWADVTESIQDIVGAQATNTSTIVFTYDDGAATLSAAVVDNTSTQKSIYSLEGTNIGTRQELNFIDGTGVNIEAVDAAGDDRVNVTVKNTGLNSAVNLTASGTTFNLVSGTPVQGDGSQQLQVRPLKLGSNQLTASLTDSNQSVTLDLVPGNIDINTLNTGTPLAVSVGGTGSSNAAAARTALGVAKAGVNSDLTEIQGLTTALTVAQGGTGGGTAAAGLFNLQGLKVLESIGSTGESLIANGSASVSGEFRGQLKTIRPFSNKIAVDASVNNEVTIDVNADNVLSAATTPVNFNGVRLTNVALPLSDTDVATKAYSDSVAQGLTVKEASRVASTVNFVGTYSNTIESVSAVDVGADTLTSNSHAFTNGDRVNITSTGGSVPGGLAAGTQYFVVGTTANTFQLSATEGGSAVNITDSGSGTIQVSHVKYLTAGSNGAISIDGVALSLNDRVLLQDQTDQTQNGIYRVDATGSGSAKAVLVRADDFNASGEMSSGSFTFVQEGTVNASIAFVQITTDPIIDVSNIVFTPFSTANIPDGTVTNAKLADMATGTILGRQTGSTTGDPEDLTADQVVAIVNTMTSAASIDGGTY